MNATTLHRSIGLSSALFTEKSFSVVPGEKCVTYEDSGGGMKGVNAMLAPILILITSTVIHHVECFDIREYKSFLRLRNTSIVTE